MKHYYKVYLVAYSGEGVNALFYNHEAEVNFVWRKLSSMTEVFNSLESGRLVDSITFDQLEVK